MSDELEALEADIAEQFEGLSEAVAEAKQRGEVIPPEVEAGLAEMEERIYGSETDEAESEIQLLAEKVGKYLQPQVSEEARLDAAIKDAAEHYKDTRRAEEWSAWMNAKAQRAQHEATKQAAPAPALSPLPQDDSIGSFATQQSLAAAGLGAPSFGTQAWTRESLQAKTAEYQAKAGARKEAWLAEGRAAFARRDEPGSIEWSRFVRNRPAEADEIREAHRKQEAADKLYLAQLRALPPEPPNPYGGVTNPQRASG